MIISKSKITSLLEKATELQDSFSVYRAGLTKKHYACEGRTHWVDALEKHIPNIVKRTSINMVEEAQNNLSKLFGVPITLTRTGQVAILIDLYERYFKDTQLELFEEYK